MAASFTYTHATVDTPGGQHVGVAVAVRAGQVVLRKGAAPVVSRNGVVASPVLSKNTRTVEFEDGEVWTVTRTRKPCGCS